MAKTGFGWLRRSVNRPRPDPARPAPARTPLQAKWAALVAIVGAPVALALSGYIPAIESGRSVDVAVAEDGTFTMEHLRGRQYLEVYKDAVGVNTACDGITTINGVPLRDGHTFTEEQCAELLLHELAEHAGPVMWCTPSLAISDDPEIERMREGPRFLAVSLGYNVGVGNYCRSTARKLFNAGDYDAGCEAATWWNKAGGRVLRGLVRRRNEEALVCTEGLDALAEILR